MVSSDDFIIFKKFSNVFNFTAVNTINHPFHLHGHKLFVMDMGQHPDKSPMTVAKAKKLTFTRRKSSLDKTRKHLIKDTISIPSKGYTIFRFKADNPGWWLLHCHYGNKNVICKRFDKLKHTFNFHAEWHMAVGMGLVVQVGETSEMVKPPENFPKCGNYKPIIDSSIFNTRL